jgi:hypothetical protein
MYQETAKGLVHLGVVISLPVVFGKKIRCANKY